MKLFYIEITDHDTPEVRIFNHAFTNRENADWYAGEFNDIHRTKTATVKEADLPFIGRSVCYVRKDMGIANTIGTDMPMHEIIWNSQIYSCVTDAKGDKLWQNSLKFFEQNPEEKKHETDIMIATDKHGEPFGWGDYYGFVTTIERIRVVKAGYYDYNECLIPY